MLTKEVLRSSARLLIFIGLMLVFTAAYADEKNIEFQASVSKERVELEEPFVYQLQVKGVFKGEPEIDLPELEQDFIVLSTSRSHRTVFSKGKRDNLFILALVLQAKRAGSFAIEPAILHSGKKVIKTKQLKVSVEGALEDKEEKPLKAPEFFKEKDAILL